MLLLCRHVDSGFCCPGSGALADGGIELAGLAPTTGQPLAAKGGGSRDALAAAAPPITGQPAKRASAIQQHAGVVSLSERASVKEVAPRQALGVQRARAHRTHSAPPEEPLEQHPAVEPSWMHRSEQGGR